MKKTLLLLAGALGIASVRGQGESCNVRDASVSVLSAPNFNNAATQSLFKILFGVSEFEDGAITLVEQAPGTGQSVGQFWSNEKIRLADGFIADIDFTLTGPFLGIGFAVQNDKIVNAAGSTDDDLGLDGLVRMVRVRLLCSDTCQAILEAVDNGGQVTELGSQAIDDITDGSSHKATLVYLENTNVFQFQLDNGAILDSGTNPVNLAEQFGGATFAFIGGSAVPSSNDESSQTATIESVTVSALPPLTEMTTNPLQESVRGRTFTFVLQSRDSCQKLVPTDPSLVDEGRIFARLNFSGPVGEEFVPPPQLMIGRDFLEPTNITYDSVAQVINILFDMPNVNTGTWNLEMVVDGVIPEGIPCQSCVITIDPDQGEGISPFGLALLIALIVVILLGLAYAVVRLRRYRRKLAENKEDIEAGKEKHHLDMLEKDVTFNMNPLMGSLEEMREKLRQNEAELKRLRDGRGERYDDDHTIGVLQQQNAELRDEMNKLKKEKQQKDAVNTSFRPAGSMQPTKRKEYEQSRPY